MRVVRCRRNTPRADPAPARGRPEPVPAQESSNRGGRHSKAELRQFPLNPLIAPPRISRASMRINAHVASARDGRPGRPPPPLDHFRRASPRCQQSTVWASQGRRARSPKPSGGSPRRGRAGRSDETEVGQCADGATISRSLTCSVLHASQARNRRRTKATSNGTIEVIPRSSFCRILRGLLLGRPLLNEWTLQRSGLRPPGP